MKLVPGDIAPTFSLKDLEGNNVRLEAFRGRQILLSFFRDTTCIFCNLRVHQIIKWIKAKKDSKLVIITFFTSPKEEIVKFTANQNSPFNVIADPKLTMYEVYGLESSLKGKMIALLRFKKIIQSMHAGLFSLRSLPRRNTLPADFLIGPDLTIHHAHYGKDFGDHLPLEFIDNWIG